MSRQTAPLSTAACLDPLPDIMLAPLVAAALAEDLGRGGDVTSAAVVAADRTWCGSLVARAPGVLAGLDVARLVFQTMDPDVRFTAVLADGDAVVPGSLLARVEGRARALLAAERTALNFLCRLSGIATATKQLCDAIKPYPTRIAATRKTTPGLRHLEKYAVRVGGGLPHRMGLDDAILIKDNHVALAGGVIPAVQAARRAAGHMMKIELEVDTLEQLDQALDLPIDAILLDNMTPAQLTEAVRRVGGRFLTEASGRVGPDTIAAIAATGVDIISVGWLTHSVAILDIGFDDRNE